MEGGVVSGFLRDWLLARYLARRCNKSVRHFVRRKADGTLWAAGSPQSLSYAMAGLFNGRAHFHFQRVRIWKGLPIVSRKVFWRPEGGEFNVLETGGAFLLPPWPVPVECAKIDAYA